MNDDIKKELDQLGDLVDSKIEKATNAASDNLKGEVDESLKSEISNLTNEYMTKHEELNKRMDNIEVSNKKLEKSNEMPLNFKSALKKSIDDGAIESLKKGNSRAASFLSANNDLVLGLFIKSFRLSYVIS